MSQPYSQAELAEQVKELLDQARADERKKVLEEIEVFRYEKCREFETSTINELLKALKLYP